MIIKYYSIIINEFSHDEISIFTDQLNDMMKVNFETKKNKNKNNLFIYTFQFLNYNVVIDIDMNDDEKLMLFQVVSMLNLVNVHYHVQQNLHKYQIQPNKVHIDIFEKIIYVYH